MPAMQPRMESRQNDAPPERVLKSSEFSYAFLLRRMQESHLPAGRRIPIYEIRSGEGAKALSIPAPFPLRVRISPKRF